MKNFQIECCQVDEENRILELEFSGSVEYPVPEGQLRFMVIFQSKEQDRHYPVTALCQRQDGETVFHAQVQILLEYVFLEYRRETEETISLRFACCDLKKEWQEWKVSILLSAYLFEKRRMRGMFWRRLGNRVLYVFCTLLLPVWLVDGCLAVWGKKELHPGAREMGGVKAVLYHANGLVSGWTGYGYSLREIKTNYFAKQYKKFCRGIKETQGVLLLSERRVEPGSNLDLVRERLIDFAVNPIKEFLNTRPVHKLSWKELRQCARLLAGAKVVVLEDFYPQLHALTIRPETEVLQMWHACGAFKLFGLSELGLVTHLEQSTRNHRNYTAALTSAETLVPFYSEAFGIKKEYVRPIGVPRTDVFFDSAYRERIREELFSKYPVCQGKRVILYAPTFRGSGNKTAYFPLERFPLEQILSSLPEDVVLILKNHPFVKDHWQKPEKYEERILDLSEGENINDLLFITDLLVTDYSSVIFEAALLHIPMLFYAFDLEKYMQERNLYFSYSAFVPGVIAATEEELIAQLSRGLEQPWNEEEKYEDFVRFFLSALDGHSTQRTTELILEMLKKKTDQ